MVDKRTRFLTIRDVESDKEERYECGIDLDLSGEWNGGERIERWAFTIETLDGAWVWTVVKAKPLPGARREAPYRGGLKGLGDCVKDIYRYVDEIEYAYRFVREQEEKKGAKNG